MPSETVTKTGTGAEVKAEGQTKVTPSVETKAPAAVKVSSTEEEPKLYTQKQFDDFVHMVKSEAGRDRKAMEVERDQFKSKAEKLESKITVIQSERDKLQSDLEEMSSDDPKKFDIIKRDRELREAQRALQSKADELAEKEKASQAKIKIASETMLEINIWDIAAEYKNSDPIKLKDLCATFGATSEEQIRKVADTMWEKENPAPQTEEQKQAALKLVSGKTRGGATDYSSLSPDEKLKEGFRQLKK